MIKEEELESDQRESDGSVSGAGPITPIDRRPVLAKIDDVEERSESSDQEGSKSFVEMVHTPNTILESKVPSPNISVVKPELL